MSRMPAPKKRFYKAAEIQTILGVSRGKANAIMHMFEQRGQLFRDGNTLRVEVKVFDEWLEERTARRA